MDDPSTDDSAPGDPGARRPDAGSGPGGAPADNDEVVAELERLLLAHGPMPIEALAAALAESRPDLAAPPAAQRGDAAPSAGTTATTIDGDATTARVTAIAQQSDAFWRLPDERIAPVLHHLRRATFTHRLTDAELARQAIDLEPDIVALAIGRTATGPGDVPLRTAGPEDDPRADEHGSLLGPDGWLAGRAAGELLAVGYDGERVRIDPIGPDSLRADATAAAIEALRSTFPLLPTQRAAEVHRLVVDTLGLHPEAFAEPVAPLTELVAAAGLRRRGPWVGAADRRWATPAEQARSRRLEELLAPADVCCQLAGRRALEAWHRALEAEEQDGAEERGEAAADAKLVADIDHGGIAAALAEVATMGRPLVFVRRLGRWAAELAERTGTDAAALGYLRALGADAGGDAEAAEAALRAGLALEADHPACLGFLAELAGDRGDAAAALALLQRTGRPITAEVLGELEPFLVPRNVGRNDPCPCGSGRKFKACCARGPAPRPLPVRLRWLRTRAMRHAVRNDPLTVQSLRQIFDVSNGGADSFAIVLDMLLFPSRGLRRYLDARGALLPADERATARTWLDQPMRLLEVDRAGTDATVDASDARTGEQLTIDDPAAAVTLSAGELVLCRPLPAGDAWVLSGTMIRVPPEGRERTLQLLAEEAQLRPFHLLHLLVDFQVAALRL